MTKFNALFSSPKTILGMLHLRGGPDHVRSVAIEEAKILAGEGFDGVIVENYFGTSANVEEVLLDLLELNLGLRIGVNLLGSDEMAFALARRYPVDFIQLDSVAGHLRPSMDAPFAETLAAQRASVDALVLGGVRFKYQPVASERTEAEDVLIGAARCDAIVVTSEGTGIETKTDKIDRFRAAAPEGFPLIVGAGLTPHNVAAQMANAQGGIVGSWLKEDHVDKGAMSVQNVRTFMKAFRSA